MVKVEQSVPRYPRYQRTRDRRADRGWLHPGQVPPNTNTATNTNTTANTNTNTNTKYPELEGQEGTGGLGWRRYQRRISWLPLSSDSIRKTGWPALHCIIN